MHLPPSNGFKFIVQGRCLLVHYPEFDMLRKENAQAIGECLLWSFIYWWGMLSEIVSDNGAPFIKAIGYLACWYHIRHIHISGYNLCANGLVERSHFDVRQALFKACDSIQSKWASVTYSIFWADHITTCRRMGCSPYFAVTETHPLLPFDISEATYLLPPPDSILSTEDLISHRTIALQKHREHLSQLHSKVYEARLAAAMRFEKEHSNTIKDFNFKLGDLVLIQHMAIEKALNRKMRPRYQGPAIVISRNRGSAYIIAELDSTLADRPVATFHVIPYFVRTKIHLPPLEDLLDVSIDRLRELEHSTEKDTDELFDSDNESVATHDEEDDWGQSAFQ